MHTRYVDKEDTIRIMLWSCASVAAPLHHVHTTCRDIAAAGTRGGGHGGQAPGQNILRVVPGEGRVVGQPVENLQSYHCPGLWRRLEWMFTM